MNPADCLSLVRRVAWPAALFASSAMAGGLAAAEPSSVQPATSAPASGSSAAAPPAKIAERLREGAKLIDVTGSFQFSGDRVAFSPQGTSDSLRVLENLALERVSRLLTEGRGAPVWVVSGTITEFRGANYLLLTKAVLKLNEGRPAAP